MLDKMKQPLELLIKRVWWLRVMRIYSTVQLRKKLCGVFDFLKKKKKKVGPKFPAYPLCSVMRKEIFSFRYRIHTTSYNRFMRNRVHPCIFAYFAHCYLLVMRTLQHQKKSRGGNIWKELLVMERECSKEQEDG